jgi:restriction endonuclease Mrr
VLSQLTGLTPTGFEAAVVSIFREFDEVRHNITRTRPTADGGFDFFGTFTLPPPIQYEIPFLGEAKRYARSTAVGPKDVSRLVARLARGQYGIFVTTSYYTKQTQEEVLEDRYPTTLVAGADLVRIMREMRLMPATSTIAGNITMSFGPTMSCGRVLRMSPTYLRTWYQMSGTCAGGVESFR